MIKRFGTPPDPASTYHPRPGVYAVLPRGHQILLTCQYDPDPEFQLPGGGIDPGESPLMALHREVMEETGWTITRPRRLGAFRRFVFMPEYDLMAEKICHVYLARPALQICEPTEPQHACHWTTPDRAADLVANPGDRAFLLAQALRRSIMH